MRNFRESFLSLFSTFHLAVVLVFLFFPLMSLKELLFSHVPALLGTYDFNVVRLTAFDVLLALSSVLILCRRKLGVWLWIAAVAIDLILLLLKKNGRTAWSVLR